MAYKNKTFKSATGKKYDQMMARCYRKSDASYKGYGDKGIKVTGKWAKDINEYRKWFKKQLKALGISEDEFVANTRNYQVDRINSKGHYTEKNCRIVTAQQNNLNRRNRKKRTITTAEGEKIVY